MKLSARVLKIAEELIAASGRGKRHRKPTSKGKAEYRKLKQEGGGQFLKKKNKLQKKWRKTKGRSAPSARKSY